MTGIGGFVLQQYAFGETDGPTFDIRDASGALGDGSSDELVVLDMLDKTNSYSEETIKIFIQINGGEELECKWKYSGVCTFEYLEVFDDRRLTAQESILISEGTSDLCSGIAEQSCKITANVIHENSEEDENMQVTVETVDLGSYTFEAV